jgi:hypothetical protein
MAIAVVDPSKAKYFPEMIPEVLNETSVTTGGNQVAQYILQDRIATLENFAVFTQTANLNGVVTCDSREVIRSRSDAPSLTDPRRYSKVTARESIDVSLVMASGGPTANVRSSWFITTRKPLAVDKLRRGDVLDDAEKAVSDAVALGDYIDLGVIPRHQSLLNIDPSKMFDDIVIVERNMAAIAAGGEAVIGGKAINAYNKLIVLLGVYVDTGILAAGTPDDTFFIVDRDADTALMKLDITGMPDNLFVPCYIPAIDKLNVRITSTTGTGALTVPCGFMYGIRPLTAIDRLQWNIGWNSPIAKSDAANLYSRYPDLVSRIRAGII